MAEFHLNRSWLGNGQKDTVDGGKIVEPTGNAVLSAAYRAGLTLTRRKTGATYNYSRKRVVCSGILLPDGADDEFLEREHLWSSADEKETYVNARYAMEDEFALPIELSTEQHLEIIKEYVADVMHPYGLAVDYAVHNPHGNNPHVHLMATTRAVEGSRLARRKSPLSRFKHGSLLVEYARLAAAEAINGALERAGYEQRVSQLSYARLGFEQFTPSRHRGWDPAIKTVEAKRKQREADAAYTQMKNGELLLEDPALALRVLRARKSVFSVEEIEAFVALHCPEQKQKNLYERIIDSPHLCVVPGAEDSSALFSFSEVAQSQGNLIEECDELFTRRPKRLSRKHVRQIEDAIGRSKYSDFAVLAAQILDGRALDVADVADAERYAMAALALQKFAPNAMGEVVFLAQNSAEASRLRAEHGLRASTVNSLLWRHRNGGGLKPNATYIVSRAELLASGTLEEFIALTKESTAKVVVTGNSKGLVGYDNAGGFSKLLKRYGEKVERALPGMDAALIEALREEPEKALDQMRKQKRLVVTESKQQSADAVASRVADAYRRDSDGHHVAVVSRHMRRAYAGAIRHRLKGFGVIGHEFCIDITRRRGGKEEVFDLCVGIGEMLRLTGYDASTRLRAGAVVKVLGFDGRSLRVRHAGQEVCIDATKFNRFEYAYTQSIERVASEKPANAVVVVEPGMSADHFGAALSASKNVTFVASSQAFDSFPSIAAGLRKTPDLKSAAELARAAGGEFRDVPLRVRIQSRRVPELASYLKARRRYLEVMTDYEGGFQGDTQKKELESARNNLSKAKREAASWQKETLRCASTPPVSVAGRIRSTQKYRDRFAVYQVEEAKRSKLLGELAGLTESQKLLPSNIAKALRYGKQCRKVHGHRRALDKMLTSSRESRSLGFEFRKELRAHNRSQKRSSLALFVQDDVRKIGLHLEAKQPSQGVRKPIDDLSQATLRTLDALRSEGPTFSKGAFLHGVLKLSPDFGFAQRVYEHAVSSGQLVALASGGRGKELGGIEALKHLDAVFADRRVVQMESRLVRQLDALFERRTHKVSVDAAKAGVDALPFSLNDEQHRLLSEISDDRGLVVIQGLAGVGKSAMLRAANTAWAQEGREVIGAAFAGRAAAGLQESANIPSRTAYSLIQDARNGMRLPEKSVLVVDEAGMLSTDDMRELALLARRSKAKLVMVGGVEQLGAIGLSGAFDYAVKRYAPKSLDNVLRQSSAAQREALEAVAKGRTEEGMASLREQGLICDVPTRKAALEAMAQAYVEEPEASEAIMLAHARKDVAALNLIAREKLRAAGRIKEGRIYKSDGSKVELAVNDRIVFLKNHRKLGVFNGTVATVSALDSGSVSVLCDDGQRVLLDGANMPAVQHAYAMSVHKSQGVTKDAAFVLFSKGFDANLNYTALSRHRHRLKAFEPKDVFPSERSLLRTVGRRQIQDLAISHASLKDAPKVNGVDIAIASTSQFMEHAAAYRRGFRDDQVAMRPEDKERLCRLEQHARTKIHDAITDILDAQLNVSGKAYEHFVESQDEYREMLKAAHHVGGKGVSESEQKALMGSPKIKHRFVLTQIREKRIEGVRIAQLTQLHKLQRRVAVYSADRSMRIDKVSSEISKFIDAKIAKQIPARTPRAIVRAIDRARRDVASAMLALPGVRQFHSGGDPYTRSKELIAVVKERASNQGDKLCGDKRVRVLLAQARSLERSERRFLVFAVSARDYQRKLKRFDGALLRARPGDRRRLSEKREKLVELHVRSAKRVEEVLARTPSTPRSTKKLQAYVDAVKLSQKPTLEKKAKVTKKPRLKR